MILVQHQARRFQRSVLIPWQATWKNHRPSESTKQMTWEEMAPTSVSATSRDSQPSQTLPSQSETSVRIGTLHEEVTLTDTRPTFHPFPRLPPELREQIWHLTIPPRVIHLSIIRSSFAIARNFVTLPAIPVSLTDKSMIASLLPMSNPVALPAWESRFFRPPIALSVYRESREVVLGSYGLGFEKVLTNGLKEREGDGEKCLREGRIWVDFKRDNFCVNEPSRYCWDANRFESTFFDFSTQNQMEIGRIRNLTIVGSWDTTKLRDRETLVEMMKHYTMLRNLTVVYSSMGKRQGIEELEAARAWMEVGLVGIWEDIWNGDAVRAGRMPNIQVLTCVPGR